MIAQRFQRWVGIPFRFRVPSGTAQVGVISGADFRRGHVSHQGKPAWAGHPRGRMKHGHSNSGRSDVTPRARAPEPKAPDWSPDKTVRILRQQLNELQKMKGRSYREIENELRAWDQFTASALVHGFGEDSANEHNFATARSAGQWRIGGMPESQIQRNYQLRIDRYEAALNSSIKELEYMLPEQELTGAYEPGDEYAFYRDLKTILATARADVLIVDKYLNVDVFDVYVDGIQQSAMLRVLSNRPSDSALLVMKKYASGRPFELRTSNEVHDRVIFADGRCWVIGQSIKDAAKKKPTYIVEVDSSRMLPIYEDIWSRSEALIRS